MFSLLKKIFFILVAPLLIWNNHGIGQNLVNNPGFENFNSCPHFVGEVNKCTGWSSFGNSSDYFNTCDTFYVDVPQNILGYQYPYSGDAYCGVYNYDLFGYREYIGSLLIDSLNINTKYFVSMEVVLANFGPCTTNRIGILFSTVPYSDTMPPAQQNYAHVFSQSLISDTLNWTRISGSFIADSNYKYIIVGNFFDNAHTDTLDCGQSAVPSYYFLDDLCVSSDSVTCTVINKIPVISDENELIIYPNPAKDWIIIKNNKPQSPVNQVFIYDFFSKPIYCDINKIDNNSFLLDLKNLPSGVYFLKIILKNNQCLNYKIINN